MTASEQTLGNDGFLYLNRSAINSLGEDISRDFYRRMANLVGSRPEIVKINERECFKLPYGDARAYPNASDPNFATKTQKDIVDQILAEWNAAAKDKFPQMIPAEHAHYATNLMKRLGASALYGPDNKFMGWNFRDTKTGQQAGHAPTADRFALAAAVVGYIQNDEILTKYPIHRLDGSMFHFQRSELTKNRPELGAYFSNALGKIIVTPDATLDPITAMEPATTVNDIMAAEAEKHTAFHDQVKNGFSIILELGLSEQVFGQTMASLDDIESFVPAQQWEQLYNQANDVYTAFVNKPNENDADALAEWTARFGKAEMKSPKRIYEIGDTPYRSLQSASKAMLGAKPKEQAQLRDVANMSIDRTLEAQNMREKEPAGAYSVDEDIQKLAKTLGHDGHEAQAIARALQDLRRNRGVAEFDLVKVGDAEVSVGPIVAFNKDFIVQAVENVDENGVSSLITVHLDRSQILVQLGDPELKTGQTVNAARYLLDDRYLDAIIKAGAQVGFIKHNGLLLGMSMKKVLEVNPELADARRETLNNALLARVLPEFEYATDTQIRNIQGKAGSAARGNRDASLKDVVKSAEQPAIAWYRALRGQESIADGVAPQSRALANGPEPFFGTVSNIVGPSRNLIVVEQQVIGQWIEGPNGKKKPLIVTPKDPKYRLYDTRDAAESLITTGLFNAMKEETVTKVDGNGNPVPAMDHGATKLDKDGNTIYETTMQKPTVTFAFVPGEKGLVLCEKLGQWSQRIIDAEYLKAERMPVEEKEKKASYARAAASGYNSKDDNDKLDISHLQVIDKLESQMRERITSQLIKVREMIADEYGIDFNSKYNRLKELDPHVSLDEAIADSGIYVQDLQYFKEGKVAQRMGNIRERGDIEYEDLNGENAHMSVINTNDVRQIQGFIKFYSPEVMIVHVPPERFDGKNHAIFPYELPPKTGKVNGFNVETPLQSEQEVLISYVPGRRNEDIFQAQVTVIDREKLKEAKMDERERKFDNPDMAVDRAALDVLAHAITDRLTDNFGFPHNLRVSVTPLDAKAPARGAVYPVNLNGNKGVFIATNESTYQRSGRLDGRFVPDADLYAEVNQTNARGQKPEVGMQATIRQDSDSGHWVAIDKKTREEMTLEASNAKELESANANSGATL